MQSIYPASTPNTGIPAFAASSIWVATRLGSTLTIMIAPVPETVAVSISDASLPKSFALSNVDTLIPAFSNSAVMISTSCFVVTDDMYGVQIETSFAFSCAPFAKIGNAISITIANANTIFFILFSFVLLQSKFCAVSIDVTNTSISLLFNTALIASTFSFPQAKANILDF